MLRAAAPSLSRVVPDGRPHKFEARAHQFFIDGEPTMLLAGEMHFGRIVPEFFEQRIRQARAMGLNTISLYLFWNQCEPQQGKFDFTGFNDVRKFIQLCQANGMWVVLRPGPYCCAETEFGGIPWWLLKDRDIKLRTADPKFLDASKKYINEVFKQVGDLQISHGGPIVMVQMENEYGRIDPYMKSLHAIFKDAGFDGQLFTCDHHGGAIWRDGAETMPGVMHCRNGLDTDEVAAQIKNAVGDFPVFSPEVYTAWYSIWGGPVANKPIDEQLQWTNWLIDHDYSFSLYMFCGGTNFGFTNGSNQLRPVQTSYNYDAPVDEAGRITPKFNAMRELIAKRFSRELPAIPQDLPSISIPAIHLDAHQSLLATLPEKPTATSAAPLSMEDLDQGYGMVVYRRRFDAAVSGTLELRAMDYALVMLDGKTVGKSFIGYGPQSSRIAIHSDGPTTLDVLVYNLGRTSSPFNQASGRKGLSSATLDGKEVRDWQMFSLPMENAPKIAGSSAQVAGPTLFTGRFTLEKTGETFLDLSNFSFGVVWVNGHNLGRFWDCGALRSLYLPSVWQKTGENEVVVLELHDPPANPTISGGTQIVTAPPKAFNFVTRPRRTPTTRP